MLADSLQGAHRREVVFQCIEPRHLQKNQFIVTDTEFATNLRSDRSRTISVGERRDIDSVVNHAHAVGPDALIVDQRVPHRFADSHDTIARA